MPAQTPARPRSTSREYHADSTRTVGILVRVEEPPHAPRRRDPRFLRFASCLFRAVPLFLLADNIRWSKSPAQLFAAHIKFRWTRTDRINVPKPHGRVVVDGAKNTSVVGKADRTGLVGKRGVALASGQVPELDFAV